MRSDSVPGISGLDSPRLDEEDCWSRHWGGGSNAHQWEKSAAQVHRGKSVAHIVRRTWARRRTVQARQENSSRGYADETVLV